MNRRRDVKLFGKWVCSSVDGRFVAAVLVLGLIGGCASKSSEIRPGASRIAGTPAETVSHHTPIKHLASASKSVAEAFSLPSAADGMDPIQPAGFAELLQDVEDVENGRQVSGRNAGYHTGLEEDVTPLQSTEAHRQEDVEHFVAMALAGHPSIQATRQRVAAEISRIAKERGLPDPVFNNTFWPVHDQSLQTAAGRVGNQMSLSQAIPWPEKLRAKAAVVSQEVQVARAEVDRVEREIAESVRLAYHEVWYANQALDILEETRGLVDDLARVAGARYRSGGTQQDVLRAALESDRLDDQEIGLRRQKEMAQADLAALVQQPVALMPEPLVTLHLADIPKQLDDLVALAEQCNPKLKGLAWEIQRDRQKQRLACLQQYPDLQIGMNWGLVSDGGNVLSPVANGHDQINFNVGTSLPIWRGKTNAGIREAGHRTGSSLKRLDAERDALFGEIRRLLAQADAFSEQRAVYRDRIIPRSEATLKLAIADYRGKRTDFFSLIETYRELLVFETQLARIEASLAGTLARLERAIGCQY